MRGVTETLLMLDYIHFPQFYVFGLGVHVIVVNQVRNTN